jgi:hypothetical protein
MSGGGGGGGVPQDNSLQIEMMRQQAARDEQARQDRLKEEAKQEFQTKLGSAVTGARQTGLDYLGQRGLSGDQYGSIIDSIINDTRLKVPELDSNPGGYFTSDTFASGLDRHQTNQRANYNTQVQSRFNPGFENSLIADTADDPILQSILNTQRQSAEKQLDFNRARGLLNDSGYNTAFGELGSQANAGMSTLTGIGDSILGKSRQALSGIKGEAGSTASNWSLGQAAPNLDDFYSRAQTKAQSDIGNLEGSIRSALGSTNLFDVAGAIAKGGTAQGPINLTTAETAPGMPQLNKKTQANRGVGSSGVF